MLFQRLTTPTGLLALFIGTMALILLAFEVGRWIGRWRSGRPNPEPHVPARMIISSVLSLSAFVLGFTFGTASSHYAARNQSLDDESIAITTAFHRADLLSEPTRTNVRDLLRQYVKLRLGVSQSSNVDEVTLEVRQLQDQIWDELISPQKKDNGQPPPTIVVQSLSEMIDVNAERVLQDMRSRIPRGVWFFIYGISLISVVAAGYHSGLAGARRPSIAAVAYALAFAGVIVVIMAADNPSIGQFEENRQALIDLDGRFGSLSSEYK